MRLAALLSGYVALATSGLLLLRGALDDKRFPGEGFLEKLWSPGGAIGAALYGASFLLWLVTLQRYPVSTVYPVFVGAAFVGVALGGWLVLDEGLGVGRTLGAIVILAGILLVTR